MSDQITQPTAGAKGGKASSAKGLISGIPMATLLHISMEVFIAAGMIFWFQKKTGKLEREIGELRGQMASQAESIERCMAIISQQQNVLHHITGGQVPMMQGNAQQTPRPARQPQQPRQPQTARPQAAVKTTPAAAPQARETRQTPEEQQAQQVHRRRPAARRKPTGKKKKPTRPPPKRVKSDTEYTDGGEADNAYLDSILDEEFGDTQECDDDGFCLNEQPEKK